MSRRLSRLSVLAAAAALLVSACGSSTSGPVAIRWYCCLGTGEDPAQIKVEQAVADAFNASHPNIKLTFEPIPNQSARDTLATQLASGNGPDIVGPVGIGGAEAFHGQWLDLQPYIDKNKYDMSQFPASTVHLYNVGGEGQLGIPFAVYPSVLFYKAGLFKEAGLAEPPHEWGAKYTMPDGSVVDWDYATATKVAKLLTVDKNGKDATDPSFDPQSIVQWGFEPQRDDLRQTGAYWKAGAFATGADGKTAQVPAAWAEAWKWFYQGIWTDHIMMTGPQFVGKDTNPNGYPFFTGNVAMSENYLWSTYGVADAGDDWNMAATPSYDGQTTAALNADTFRILKSSKHPDEAFTVLTYLLGDASNQLLQSYSGMPARVSDQDAFFKTAQEAFTQTIDWQVAKDGIAYADVPNFEGYMPAYNESLDLIITFGTKWQATPGLDMDTEIQDLQTQLQAIWDKAG
jgi:multiple sugar transport system substrate-binding protein